MKRSRITLEAAPCDQEREREGEMRGFLRTGDEDVRAWQGETRDVPFVDIGAIPPSRPFHLRQLRKSSCGDPPGRRQSTIRRFVGAEFEFQFRAPIIFGDIGIRNSEFPAHMIQLICGGGALWPRHRKSIESELGDKFRGTSLDSSEFGFPN